MSDNEVYRLESTKGQQAKIIDDPAIQEALNLLRDNLHAQWETSPLEDREGREEAKRMLHAVNEFERHFRSLIETGKLAEKELSLLDRVKKVVKLK